jgi:drug/metabolite transporter (DMT)-like permease
MTTRTDHRLVPAALLALGVTWGSAFILIDVLVGEISPTQITAARLTIGAVTVAAILTSQRRLGLPARGIIVPAILLSLVDNTIPNSLVAWSETRIDAGLASVLMATMPIFTTIFAVALLKEETSPVRVLGIAVAFTGVMIVSNGDLLDIRSNNGLGLLAVVGASASHGIGAIYTKTLLKREDPLRLTGYKLTFGAAMAAPLVLAVQGPSGYVSMSPGAVASLLLLGVFATGGAYSVYVWVVGKAGSVQASLVTYIIPVFGVFFAWLLLGEPVGVNMVAGGLVIAAGVAFAIYNPSIPLPRISLPRRQAGAEASAENSAKASSAEGIYAVDGTAECGLGLAATRR